MNERNQKVLSRAIHVIFSLPKIGEVVCEISSKEHEGPSSLLLKAPHIYILDTKDILVSAVLLLLPLSHESDRLWAFFCLGRTVLTMKLWLGSIGRYSADEAHETKKRSSFSILKSGQNIPHFGLFLENFFDNFYENYCESS